MTSFWGGSCHFHVLEERRAGPGYDPQLLPSLQLTHHRTAWCSFSSVQRPQLLAASVYAVGTACFTKLTYSGFPTPLPGGRWGGDGRAWGGRLSTSLCAGGTRDRGCATPCHQEFRVLRPYFRAYGVSTPPGGQSLSCTSAGLRQRARHDSSPPPEDNRLKAQPGTNGWRAAVHRLSFLPLLSQNRTFLNAPHVHDSR